MKKRVRIIAWLIAAIMLVNFTLFEATAITPPHLEARPNSRFVPTYHVYVSINPEHHRWYDGALLRINLDARQLYINQFNRTFTPSLQRHLAHYARVYGVPVRLAYALIWRESGFRPNACVPERNQTRSCGLGQVNNSNHGTINRAFGERLNFLDPYDNIRAMMFWFSGNLNAQGSDWHRALMVYNAGGGGAQAEFNRGVTSTEFSRWVVAVTDMFDITERVT